MSQYVSYLGWSVDYFKYFGGSILDWQPDHINHHLASEQGALARRIVKQLGGRSRQDIEKLIAVVDLIVQDHSGNGLDQLIEEAELEDLIGPPTAANFLKITSMHKRKNFISRYGLTVSGLLLLSEEYDLDSASPYIDIKWCEFFAICALCKLGETLAEIDSKAGYASPDIPHLRVEYQILLSASHYLFEAFNLITISERFNDRDDFFVNLNNNKHKKKISITNQINIEKRHAPVKRIKDKFVTFFKEKRYRAPDLTRSAAATEFYLLLSPSEKRVLTPSGMESNAVRTLTSALRAHEKLKKT